MSYSGSTESVVSAQSERPPVETPIGEPDSPSAPMVESPAAISPTRSSAEGWPRVSQIEVDRYCETCGYNLYTQPVFQHTELNLLVVRCPDCGKIHAAREHTTAWSHWVKKLSVIGLIVWMALIAGWCFGLTMAQIGLNIETLHNATKWTQVAVTPAQPSVPVPTPTPNVQLGTVPVQIDSGPVQIDSGTVLTLDQAATELIRQTTILRNQTTVRTRSTRQWDPAFLTNTEDRIMLAVFRGVFGLFGFITFMLATVIFPHWRRWGYPIAAAFLASIPLVVVHYVLRDEMPSAYAPAFRLSLIYAGCYFSAAVVATFIGRIIARGFLRLLLPNRMRQVFAYLWIVDGKEPPVGSTPTSRIPAAV